MNAFYNLFLAGTVVLTLNQPPAAVSQDKKYEGLKGAIEEMQTSGKGVLIECDELMVMVNTSDSAHFVVSFVGSMVYWGAYNKSNGSFTLSAVEFSDKDSVLNFDVFRGKNGVLQSYDTDKYGKCEALLKYGVGTALLVNSIELLNEPGTSVVMRNGMTAEDVFGIYIVFDREAKKAWQQVMKSRMGNGKGVGEKSQNYNDAMTLTNKAMARGGAMMAKKSVYRTEKPVYRIRSNPR